jgi:Domain of unknown function (DUF6265)
MSTHPYPDAADPALVGTYPASAKAGGGFVWDEVLEYRVWCHPERGAEGPGDGSDYYHAFATYTEALEFSEQSTGADAPLALIRQREYIDEPDPGQYVHVKAERIAEWPVEFLRRPRRTPHTIADFLSPNAPPNRFEILRGLALALISVCFAASVHGQEKLTEHTLKLGAGAESPHATISDLARLAGHWVGPALGGEAEEIWSPPKAGSMMGMYRLVRNGKVVFYELQTLVHEGGSLILRLKHFNPDLTGWEEKQKTVDFRLVGLGEGVVQFEGMSFHREGDGKLTVYLAIEGKDGALREEVFRYARAAAEP